MALARAIGSHLLFGHLLQRATMLGGQRLPDGLQIVAGIEPVRYRADVLAERLAVSQERRAREHVDLGAGVVDVVFAGHVVAREREQTAQGIAEHRTAAMPDMHRSGRIGGDVFDIDLLGRAERASPVRAALAQHGAQRVRPGFWLEREIDEAGTGDVDGGDQVVRAQSGRDLIGKIARLGLGLLGQNHRGIGRHVAMRRIARRLDHHARQVDIRGPPALGRERAANRVHARQHIGKQMRR